MDRRKDSRYTYQAVLATIHPALSRYENMSTNPPAWAETIQSQLRREPSRVFTKTKLSSAVADAADQVDIREDLSVGDAVQVLLDHGLVVEKNLTSDKYEPFLRFALPEASIYEVALSLRPGSFLSHGSAVFLHGLTQQLPRVVYVNKEQSVKPAPSGQLSQEAIDRALANKQRESQYILRSDDWRVVLLNGKNSGGLEVGQLPQGDGVQLPVTKLERTLIDIAVRPNYAGGVHQVLEAYRSAKSKVSVNVLIATLQKMAYVYPYHQVIGFYMQRAGYDEARLTRLRSLGMRFDFYLSNAIKEREYDETWKLFIPKGF
jgi:hypothetical protein